MTVLNGTRLDEALAERGHGSRAWLARELGVSRVALHRWLTGRAPWPAARATRAAELLGVDRAELFDD